MLELHHLIVRVIMLRLEHNIDKYNKTKNVAMNSSPMSEPRSM
jgi:hypothetical protein